MIEWILITERLPLFDKPVVVKCTDSQGDYFLRTSLMRKKYNDIRQMKTRGSWRWVRLDGDTYRQSQDITAWHYAENN